MTNSDAVNGVQLEFRAWSGFADPHQTTAGVVAAPSEPNEPQADPKRPALRLIQGGKN
jgi:hypothetical protein